MSPRRTLWANADAPTSSLSVLSNTPDLSQTPQPARPPAVVPPGMTDYIQNSDTDDEGEALEVDAAAPTHEATKERMTIDFDDSDSDSPVTDLSALMRSSGSSSFDRPAQRSSKKISKVPEKMLSLTELARESKKDAAEQARILDLEQDDAPSPDPGELDPSPKLLGSWAPADREQTAKMKQVIDRTDLMVRQVTWQAFRGFSSSLEDLTPEPMPDVSESLAWIRGKSSPHDDSHQ